MDILRNEFENIVFDILLIANDFYETYEDYRNVINEYNERVKIENKQQIDEFRKGYAQTMKITFTRILLNESQFNTIKRVKTNFDYGIF